MEEDRDLLEIRQVGSLRLPVAGSAPAGVVDTHRLP